MHGGSPPRGISHEKGSLDRAGEALERHQRHLLSGLRPADSTPRLGLRRRGGRAQGLQPRLRGSLRGISETHLWSDGERCGSQELRRYCCVRAAPSIPPSPTAARTASWCESILTKASPAWARSIPPPPSPRRSSRPPPPISCATG